MFERLTSMEDYLYLQYTYWILANECIYVPVYADGWLVQNLLHPTGIRPLFIADHYNQESELIKAALEHNHTVYKVNIKLSPLLLGGIFLLSNPQNDEFIKLLDEVRNEIPEELVPLWKDN